MYATNAIVSNAQAGTLSLIVERWAVQMLYVAPTFDGPSGILASPLGARPNDNSV
jgi:hypothetical protein